MANTMTFIEWMQKCCNLDHEEYGRLSGSMRQAIWWLYCRYRRWTKDTKEQATGK